MLLSFDWKITHEKLDYIYTSFFLWNLFYLVIHMAWKRRCLDSKTLNTKNRILSITHGFISKYLAVYIIFFRETDPEVGNDWVINYLLIFSVGYFIYDSFAMFYFNLWDISIVLHHALAISGIVSSYFTDLGGYVVLSGLIIAEISNWPMHVRVILKNYGLRYTRAYETLELLYFLLYFIGRVIFGP